ncbi:DUF5794 domain-containing protein [Salinarchaeum laminariae]|uniref:DUF5794 domain-containing protein n=1 Tax=Salinarchaeum laminariae TaxID=869888 RepID=UPI0020BDA8B7|nr:DUF5794 domain-containing protein [Salinarchaeum laminariae]
MSVSRHPIALRIESLVGQRAALLATVMCLPLVDGIFPALIVAGALDSPAGIVQVGLLIFGGSAMVAVILADFDGSGREGARIVALVAVPLVALAALEAAFAPAIAGALNMVVFHRFAALVVLAVAASTASARIAAYVPRPAVVIVLGLLASIEPSNATLAATAEPELIVRGVAAALVGVGFAFLLAITSPTLRSVVDLDRFRFGSAVALGLLGVGLLPGAQEVGLLTDLAPLVVLGLSALFAFDPDREIGGWSDDASGRPGAPESVHTGANESEASSAASTGSTTGAAASSTPSSTAADGGENTGQPPDAPDDDSNDDRPPWL